MALIKYKVLVSEVLTEEGESTVWLPKDAIPLGVLMPGPGASMVAFLTPFPDLEEQKEEEKRQGAQQEVKKTEENAESPQKGAEDVK